MEIYFVWQWDNEKDLSIKIGIVDNEKMAIDLCIDNNYSYEKYTLNELNPIETYILPTLSKHWVDDKWEDWVNPFT